jgi:hypothetical protein
MTHLRSPHGLPGSPAVLEHVPDPALLREAGAGKVAKAIERALELRARCREAKAALRNAEQDVRKAEQVDRAEHARAVARSRNATLEPKNTEPAERELAEVTRRHEALCLAVENAAKELLEVGAAEREKLVEAASRARERAVARVERAAEEIEAAVAEEQAALSVARWAQDPSSRRWKVALASGEVNHIRIDKLVAGNAALAPWLADQPLPGEEVEPAKVYFGYGGGTQQSPAKSASFR